MVLAMAVGQAVHVLGPAAPLVVVGMVPPLQATHRVMPARGAYRLRAHAWQTVEVAGVRTPVAGALVHDEKVPAAQGTTSARAMVPTASTVVFSR